MHFAASIEVGESVQEPLKYYRNNLSNTQNLLSAMEAAGVPKFVFSSTAAVYGMPEKVPITEDAPKQPINPYGETKLAVERMCHYQARTGRLRFAALRYFNACGAGNNGQLGEDHRPESHLIPLIIQAAMGKRADIKIYGTDYPTPDGTCIRDYIHIDDLCRAHLLALDRLDERTRTGLQPGQRPGLLRPAGDRGGQAGLRQELQGRRDGPPAGRSSGPDLRRDQSQDRARLAAPEARPRRHGRHRLEMAYRTPGRVFGLTIYYLRFTI